MAHYDDVFMPKQLRFGSAGIPETLTQITHTASRYRYTNQLYDQMLVRLSLQYRREIADIQALRKIWYALQGPVHSCLVRDWTDWNTTDDMSSGAEFGITAFDQPLRNTTDNTFVGDGSTKTFQMVKRYIPAGAATAAHTRVITKPENGTVKVGLNGVEQTEGSPTDFTVDYANGIVTFQTAPGASESPTGVSVTWGGAFWVPAAFVADDEFETRLRNAKVDEVLAEMEEVRLS